MKRYTLVVCVSGDADTVHLLRDICDGSNKHRENLGSGVITEDHLYTIHRTGWREDQGEKLSLLNLMLLEGPEGGSPVHSLVNRNNVLVTTNCCFFSFVDRNTFISIVEDGSGFG